MQAPKPIITLSTVPGKLIDPHGENGIPSCIKSLCEQTYDNYEVHFNIPPIYKVYNTEYIIPEWLNDFTQQYPHLKIYRPEDIGPSTKIVPTLEIQASLVPTLDLHLYHTLYKSALQVKLHYDF